MLFKTQPSFRPCFLADHAKSANRSESCILVRKLPHLRFTGEITQTQLRRPACARCAPCPKRRGIGGMPRPERGGPTSSRTCSMPSSPFWRSCTRSFDRRMSRWTDSIGTSPDCGIKAAEYPAVSTGTKSAALYRNISENRLFNRHKNRHNIRHGCVRD